MRNSLFGSVDVERRVDEKEEIYKKELGMCKICGRRCDPFYFEIMEEESSNTDLPFSYHQYIIHPECKGRYKLFSRLWPFMIYVAGVAFSFVGILRVISQNGNSSGMGDLLIGIILMYIGRKSWQSKKKRNSDEIKERLQRIRIKNRYHHYP